MKKTFLLLVSMWMGIGNTYGTDKQIEAIPDWMARWEIARVLSYQKKYDESIEEYKKVLQENPDLVQARLEMGQVLFYEGEKDQAMAIFGEVPVKEWDDATKALVATLYASEKRYDLAEPLYIQYLDKHPEDLKVRLKYADMLSWEKRYDESIRQYQILLAARPQDVQLRRKYAFILIWSGRQEEGVQELRQTLGGKG